MTAFLNSRFVRRELLYAYPIPFGMALAAWVPIDLVKLMLFSAHGGLGWILLFLAFPWVLFRAAVLVLQPNSTPRRQRVFWAMGLLAAYVPMSIVCAASLMFALNPPFTNTFGEYLALHYLPLSFAFMR